MHQREVSHHYWTGQRRAVHRRESVTRDNGSGRIERLDHLVLAVAAIDETVDFSEGVLERSRP